MTEERTTQRPEQESYPERGEGRQSADDRVFCRKEELPKD
jgi:hypothetical protein